MYGPVLLPLVTLYNLFSIFNIRHPDEQEVLESLTLNILIFDTKRYMIILLYDDYLTEYSQYQCISIVQG